MANQSVNRTMDALHEKLKRQGVKSGIKTMVDLVLVIDGTGSMQNCLDAVKERATSLYSAIVAGLADKGRSVHKFRVKVIIFRDLYVDTNAYEESDFFILSGGEDDQSLEFREYVAGIKAMGGGDEPEHALEALHRAMQVEYCQITNNLKGRHIICLLTDASSHPLDDPQRDLAEYRPIYPVDMPRDLETLAAEWESAMHPTARRLIIFAPNAYPWTIVGNWNETTFEVSEAGKGLSKDAFEGVITSISGSIRAR